MANSGHSVSTQLPFLSKQRQTAQRLKSKYFGDGSEKDQNRRRSGSAPILKRDSPSSSKRSSSSSSITHTEPEIETLEPKPTGFLSFIEDKKDARKLDVQPTKERINNPRDVLLFNYKLLQYGFPDFPDTMLRALLVREQGSGLFTANQLLERGWGRGKFLSELRQLSKDPNPLLTLKYFWGKFSVDYQTILEQGGKPGEFFTATQDSKTFVVCYIDNNNTFKVRKICHPELRPLQMQLFRLSTKFPRPVAITPSFVLSSVLDEVGLVIM